MQEIIEIYRHYNGLLGGQSIPSDTLMHVHGGMIVLFAARVVTRRSLASWTPFLVVLAAALAKEAADRVAYGAWRMPDSPLDIANTIFWPLVLMIGLRWRSAHPTHASRRRAAAR
ncbi:hypothetical protein KNJ79_06425 [Sphingopyxis indica]|uniref:hypothetical protein n=1 Tax=Sphingopyxis indica TaxID=436663 RepID=UPI002938F367|nr:hypothetical protein [Sphingopyxis indica]WOF44553.1 hypothetical protein KNJ79_06425 [Sphingopyxis indica]